MTEDTKEMVKALVEGFSNSVNKLTTTFATKEDLKHEIHQVEDRLDKRMKETEERLMKAMEKQTNKVLKVLEKYEGYTEQHSRVFKRIKDAFDDEK